MLNDLRVYLKEIAELQAVLSSKKQLMLDNSQSIYWDDPTFQKKYML